YAFDLIELNGKELRREPLDTRKATLASILRRAAPGLRFRVPLCHSVPGSAAASPGIRRLYRAGLPLRVDGDIRCRLCQAVPGVRAAMGRQPCQADSFPGLPRRLERIATRFPPGRRTTLCRLPGARGHRYFARGLARHSTRLPVREAIPRRRTTLCRLP